jgi:hypothetical protein
LKKSNIALPQVSTRNQFVEEDVLPENLENFEQMVSSMEKEVMEPQEETSHVTRTTTTTSSSSRRPSKYLPDNVSFGRKTGEDLMAELKELHRNQRMARQSSGTESIIETKVYKDQDGHVVKVNEMTKQMGDDSLENEQLGGSSYMDVNLFESMPDESRSTKVKELHWDKTVPADGEISEVTEETTVGLKPVVSEAQEGKMVVADDDDLPLGETMSYEVHTTRAIGGPEALNKYGTMSTEL